MILIIFAHAAFLHFFQDLQCFSLSFTILQLLWNKHLHPSTSSLSIMPNYYKASLYAWGIMNYLGMPPHFSVTENKYGAR